MYIVVGSFLIFGLLSKATFTTEELPEILQNGLLERSDLLYTDPDDLNPEPVDLSSFGASSSNADLLALGDDTNLSGFNDETLLASSPGGPCVSLAGTDDDDGKLSLVTRDGSSCPANDQKAASPYPKDSLQLLQDPLGTLNKLGPLSSGDSADPSQPIYPGRLTDEEERAKEGDSNAMWWDLKAMGLETTFENQDWECRDDFQPIPVCCDGPLFSEPGWMDAGIESCDLGMLFHCEEKGFLLFLQPDRLEHSLNL